MLADVYVLSEINNSSIFCWESQSQMKQYNLWFEYLSHFQDWAMGVLHAKIICAITLMGPSWWLKRVIEQVNNPNYR